MLVLFCMRGRGRIARPAFPAPSDGRERDVTSKTRAKTCGEIAKPCLYAAGCLKSEAVAPKPRPSLRGACHRARIRATRWLATTLSKLPRRDREAVCRHCEERKRRSNPLFLCSARWIASSLLGKMDCFASLAMTLSKLPRRDREAGRRHCEERKRRSNPLFLCLARWIASLSLSSGARSRDPLARN